MTYLGSCSFEQGHKLSGIIYMHRITDSRMGGIARKNFSMFRKLCGDKTLKNVMLVTNMWGEVDPALGATREVELQTDDLLYKNVLDLGARMRRHENTKESALEIIQEIINNHPEALRIQTELVLEKKDITQTDACMEIDRRILELERRHQKEMDEVKETFERAMRERDEDTKKEMEELKQTLEAKMKEVEDKRVRLSQEYKEEKAMATKMLESLRVNLDEQIKQNQERHVESEQIRKARQEEINRMASEYGANARKSERKLQDAFEKQQGDLKLKIDQETAMSHLQIEVQKAKREASEQRLAQERATLQMQVERERQEEVRKVELVTIQRAFQKAQADLDGQKLDREQGEVERLAREWEQARIRERERVRQMLHMWNKEDQAESNGGAIEELKKDVDELQKKVEQARLVANANKSRLQELHHQRKPTLMERIGARLNRR